MSQNITWLGASYSDVPAVTLPKTGSGTARFTDVTDTTAIASDVAAGKYFHLATGERVAGTASGGGGDTYTLTTVVPQQTFTPQELSGSYQATVTYTAGLEDGEYYLVTYDGDEYVCTCGLYWGSDNIAGNDNLFFGNRNVNPYPFGIDYAPSTPEFAVATYDLNQHTIKVERLEFVDGPLNLIAKSVTANGTYNASSDNADGYSSVTVNVPSGSSMNVQTAQSTTRVANTAYTKTASLTCSKAGTYDVYWDCFRSSTSGTNGSQLYIGGSAYGNPNTTFANNVHAQTNHLTGVTLAANQEVAVYVRSRGTNYYAYCGQLTIVQTA